MKEFEKEVLVTILFSFLISIIVAADITLPLAPEFLILIYLILLSVWSMYRKIPARLFYYLSIIFFFMLIIIEPIGNYQLADNIAVFIFYFLVLSLVFKFLKRTE